MRIGHVAGLLVCLSVATGAPVAAAQPGSGGGSEAQETNPFAPKRPQARKLASILERDDQGRVIWVDGDPARAAIEAMDLTIEQRRTLERIMAERDNQLRQAAVRNTDKIIDAFEAIREGRERSSDAMGRLLVSSLGEFGRRGQFATDAVVRDEIDRPVYVDLNAVVREYNLARIDEEREVLLAEIGDAEVSEVMLRDSTILQRLIQRDVLADAARMLKQAYGGEAALAQAHPELAETIEQEGYWPAMAQLSDAQLGTFVRTQTGLEVHFPSPQGMASTPAEQPTAGQEPATDAAQQGGNAGNAGQAQRQRVTAQGDVLPDADGKFRFTDEDLEALRIDSGEGLTILRRGPDGRAVRLEGPSFVEAYALMLAEGMVSEQDAKRLDEILEDRDRVFDEQTLRLYEFLLAAAAHGPVEMAPLEEAVLDEDWRQPSLWFGAWLNEKLPAPSTFHNDQRIRKGIDWDTLVEMARIANLYDAGHIFDARIELLKMVRDNDEMDDPSIALPGNIKRPWRLQQIIRDAKASYARQLRVTEPDFRGVLADLDVEPEVAKELQSVVALDGPMTVADFWDVAVKLPPSDHRELIKERTGYEAPEPGFFEGKYPTPTTGADEQ
ncbi:hypothetical protein AY599_27995 [Leptolyngbya valderiana BDU 20041]|nr:hypothetical protein AY599_27995 [Leptolyngbya valderiana BDU 20041]